MKKALVVKFVLMLCLCFVLRGQAPGTPVYAIVNGMETGLRIVGGTQVQVWVYSTTNPATQVLEYNVLVPINATNCCVGLVWNAPNTQTVLFWGLAWTSGAPIQYQIWQGACGTDSMNGVLTLARCVPIGSAPVLAGTIQ
jgi:hypothetical protein